MANQVGPAALRIRGISKSFGGVRVLDAVSLDVAEGEVHGLLGENGSGKSTLIKILAGYHAPDSGELAVYDQDVKLPLRPGQFRSLGMEFVHQDLGLIPSLSVVENLRVGQLASPKRAWHISWRSERRQARKMFARYGIALSPDATVADLRPVERALLAIVRAVEGMRTDTAALQQARAVLILDEPTVFLPQAGIDQLFALIREIVADGSSVVLVSHDIDQVLETTDRITVLRDGRLVKTMATTETNSDQLVDLIIGRRLGALTSPIRPPTQRGVRVAVQGLGGVTLRDVSFDICTGEILGVTGLPGSGSDEIPYLLYGAAAGAVGRMAIDKKAFDLAQLTPPRAVAAGIALIPADRHRDGSVLSLSVADNVTLQIIEDYFQMLVLRRKKMLVRTADLMQKFDVRPRDPRLIYSALSGGNQQKALLAKWLAIEPRLFVLHEPTQGVDVGARQQIFGLIRAAAAQGTAVICASSDYEQLAAICDRVMILARGTVVRELVGGEVTKERLAEQCYASDLGLAV